MLVIHSANIVPLPQSDKISYDEKENVFLVELNPSEGGKSQSHGEIQGTSTECGRGCSVMLDHQDWLP